MHTLVHLAGGYGGRGRGGYNDYNDRGGSSGCGGGGGGGRRDDFGYGRRPRRDSNHEEFREPSPGMSLTVTAPAMVVCELFRIVTLSIGLAFIFGIMKPEFQKPE